MKLRHRYVAFVVILTILCVCKFQIFSMDTAKIGDFRGGTLDSSVWNPLVAKDVNDGLLRVIVDNKEYTNESLGVYMNEDRNIMVPVSMLRDALNCSAHVYEEALLLVEKRNLAVSFALDSLTAQTQDGEVSIVSALTNDQDEMYVSLNDLAGLLNYGCEFDINSKTLTMLDGSENVSIIPSRYDLREKDRISDIRSQGSYGTCWAFSAISAMESSLLPESRLLLSADHMSLSNSFNVNQFEGGDYTMGMAYLAAWQGPVFEKDDPYGDGMSDSSLEEVMHVQEMQIVDGKDYESIKTAVFKYGGVQTSFYSTIQGGNQSSRHYRSDTNSYCYIGTEKPNHGVVIIGWDDNYPKENFAMDLEGDGAFICQNSWGEDFGEDGVFYVSYYDSNIGTHNVVYTRVETCDNYDNIYQSDLCGWVGKLGYDKEEIYGANVYTAEKDEDVVAASFYATGANTQYAVYVVDKFANEDSLGNRKLVAQGTLAHAGYYTVDFPAVPVKEGNKYAVVVYLKTPGALRPMAVEYNSGNKVMEYVDLEDGEGYISYTGYRFINVKEKEDCNLCIKAFTNDR